MRIVTKSNTNLFGILGKVKVGELAETQNGKQYPTSLDYFRFTSNEEMRVKRMQDMFGDKPTKLPITFHCNDTDSVCVQRYEIRDSAGKLVAYGNGVNFWESQKDGFVEKAQLTPEQGERYMAALAANVKTKWSETLTLRFMVLQYPELGLWEFTTKGKDTSIGQIIAAFDAVQEMAGRVKGIPFWLTVEKHKSNRANANRQYPVVNLVCDLSPEMVETVSTIGSGIKGLITPEKIQNALPEGIPQQSDNNDGMDVEDVAFEDVTSKPEDTFLEDLSKPVPEYEVTVIAQTPDLDNLPDMDREEPADPVGQIKERFDLKPDGEPAKEEKPDQPADPRTLIGRENEVWVKTLGYLIKDGGALQTVEKKYRFADKDREHLQTMQGYRQMMMDGDMDLAAVASQYGLGEGEKGLFTELALKNGLK